MGWTEDHPLLYGSEFTGPYSQGGYVKVQDGGNGLPITVAVGDNHATGSNSMSVPQAESLIKRLKKAVKVAKKAGLG